MTPSPAVRPVLALCAAVAAAGCSLPEGPERFERMAEQVAAIPVPIDPQDEAATRRPLRTRAEARAGGGMRGAFAPVRVEVMEPKELWDNRYGALEAVAAEAAPVVVRAAARQAGDAVRPALRPAFASAGRVVQLGAFSSEAAARQAWSRLSRAEALAGLKPRFEPAEVDGRTLVRLRAGPVPAEAAAAVCRAARIDDPWCRQAG